MPTEDDTPRLGRQAADGDSVVVRDQRSIPDVTGDERLYRRLLDAVAVMTSGGVHADESYQRTLREIREDTEFIEILLRTADSLPEEAYDERWALTQLAVDLQHPRTAEYLAALIRRPVPPEQAEDSGHGQSTVTEEVILRTTAIEGLARLTREGTDATKGQVEALLDTLVETLDSTQYLSLRRAAWFALVDSGNEDVIGRARASLARRGEEWVTTMRRIPVEEAPQADPTSPDREVPPPIDG
jgi:hypothetical protein